MGLTLEQQFEKRKYVEFVKDLSDAQLLENLKQANSLLRQKTYCLDFFLQNNKLSFVQEDDLSFKFEQLLIYREFENYDRPKLTATLLDNLEALMHLDNHFRESLKNEL